MKHVPIMKTIMIPTNKLLACAIQPDSRTSAIKDGSALPEAMKKGGIVPIMVVAHPTRDGYYIVADGHRRWKAAEILGETSIPAVVNDSGCTAEELMIILNGPLKVFGAPTTFFCWATSEDRHRLMEQMRLYSKSAAKNITKMVEIVGEREAIQLAKSGHPPTLWNLADQIHSKLTDGIAKSRRANKKKIPSQKEIIEWFVRHKSNNIRIWLRSEDGGVVSRMRLLDKILSDQPFPSEEWGF